MDLLPSTSSGSRSTPQRFLFNPDTDSCVSSAPASPALPTTSGAVSRSTRAASPASSHSSDVILVGEEKPWRERTPIELSSDSDRELYQNNFCVDFLVTLQTANIKQPIQKILAAFFAECDLLDCSETLS